MWWLHVSVIAILLILVVAAGEPAGQAQASRASLEWCSPSNLNLNNASMGEFLLLNDGSFRYQLPHCRLRRFKVQEAARCMKGLHIVFMGDSLSRYFYLDLASFFAQGRWPHHFISQWPEGRSFLSEKEYNSWSWFYQETNRALNRGTFATEVCDCARNDSLPFVEFIRDMFENRHFRYIPDGNLEDAVNDVRLSYIQWWGLMPMRGHRDISLHVPRNKTLLNFLSKWNTALCPNPPEHFWPLSRNCSDQRPDIHEIDFPDFSYKEICTEFPKPTIDQWTKEERCQRFEEKILGPMGATHVLLNTGWHAGLEHVGPNFIPKTVSAANRFFATPPPDSQFQLPRVTWRQCTKGAVFEDHDKIARKFSETEGYDKLAFFSVGEITKKLRTVDDHLRGGNIAEVQKIVRTNPHWPKDREVNATTVHLIWHDNAHFEPYVYNEINNLFLNAVCPIETVSHDTHKETRKHKRPTGNEQ